MICWEIEPFERNIASHRIIFSLGLTSHFMRDPFRKRVSETKSIWLGETSFIFHPHCLRLEQGRFPHRKLRKGGFSKGDLRKGGSTRGDLYYMDSMPILIVLWFFGK